MPRRPRWARKGLEPKDPIRAAARKGLAVSRRRHETEDEIHRRVVVWLRERRVAFWHTPNETQATPQHHAHLAALGRSPGVPDLTIITPTNEGRPAALELKAERGTLRPEQRAWLAVLHASGWATACAKGYDAAIAQLTAWGYDRVFSPNPLTPASGLVDSPSSS